MMCSRIQMIACVFGVLCNGCVDQARLKVRPQGKPHRFQVVDAGGKSVAGARVCLISVDKSGARRLVHLRANAKGFVDANISGPTYARALALDPPRLSPAPRHGLERDIRSLPIDVSARLELQEIWVGGIAVPGGHIASTRVRSYGPFAEVEKVVYETWGVDLLDPWRKAYPGAVWVAGAWPEGSAASYAKILIEVVGREPKVVSIPLVRASAAKKPTSLELDRLSVAKWSIVESMRFRDPNGAVTPEPTARVLRGDCVLRRLDKTGIQLFYALRGRADGSFHVPSGRYELQVRMLSSSGKPCNLGPLSITDRRRDLVMDLPVLVRAVEVTFKGLSGFKNASLTGRHASGWEATRVFGEGRVDGDDLVIDLVLPCGTNVLELTLYGDPGKSFDVRRKVAVHRDSSRNRVKWAVRR